MSSEFELNEYFDDEVNEENTGQGPIGQSVLVPGGFYQAKVVDLVMKETYMICEAKVIASSRKDVESGTVFSFLLGLSNDGAAGKWNRKKRLAFAKATNCIQEAKSGQEKKVNYSLAVDQQFIVDLEVNEYNGKQRNQPAYDNIWHVNDPAARKKIPSFSEQSLHEDDFEPPKPTGEKSDTQQQADTFF